MQTNLTAAQRRTLGNIIAQGGLSDRKVHSGGNAPGYARHTVINDLVRKGLIECKAMGARNENGIPEAYVYFATAAGCIAFGAEIARVS